MENFENKEVLISNEDFEKVEKELEQFSKVEQLRIEINEGLERELKELQDLSAKLPKAQAENLFDKCTDSVLSAITGQFGFAAAILDSQDGGNVNTTHNARQRKYTSEEERQKYKNREPYDKEKYHTNHGEKVGYKTIKNERLEEKDKGESIDWATNEKINPNSKADLDHIVPAENIHNDPARVLAEKDGVELANTKSNLKLTNPTINRSRKTKSAEEFLEYREKQAEKLAKLQEKEKINGSLTQKQQEEKIKLERQIKEFDKIDDEAFKEQSKKVKDEIDRKIDKEYYTSPKPYIELAKTGGKDAAKMGLYSAFGVVLEDFIRGMMIELKKTFKEFGNESIKEIFKRFVERIQIIWEDIKAKWKDILKGSFEGAIQAFLSNIVTFVINTFYHTVQSLVRIIRAGFTSLYKAVKTLVNPPKDIPQEEVMFEASKILVAGMISSLTMLGAESIKTWLLTIPPLAPILSIPMPFTRKNEDGEPNETLGDAVALCISAAGGAILSTIALYYMDKWNNDSKASKLQIQIMTQGGVVVQYKIAQTWLTLHDAYVYFDEVVQDSKKTLQEAYTEITQSGEKAQEAVNKARKATDELSEFMFQRDMKKIRINRS